MTNTPTHYFNFKPCEAVQYDGMWSSLNPVTEWFEETSYVISMSNQRVVDVVFQPWDISRRPIHVEATPGQWLIRQDGKVWVQDEEPPRVERWEHSWFTPRIRPILSNGWEGP